MGPFNLSKEYTNKRCPECSWVISQFEDIVFNRCRYLVDGQTEDDIDVERRGMVDGRVTFNDLGIDLRVQWNYLEITTKPL